MSSKYGFESPEQKQRRQEQEANERARKDSEKAAQRAATVKSTGDITSNVLADYARVNNARTESYGAGWTTYVKGSSINDFSVTDKYGSKSIEIHTYTVDSDIHQVAKVLREQTGKPVDIIQDR